MNLEVHPQQFRSHSGEDCEDNLITLWRIAIQLHTIRTKRTGSEPTHGPDKGFQLYLGTLSATLAEWAIPLGLLLPVTVIV